MKTYGIRVLYLSETLKFGGVGVVIKLISFASFYLGHPQDGGILPRALDVLFNSIHGQQWETMSLKPNMFCDVMMLSAAQQETEEKIKQRVLALATDEVCSGTALRSIWLGGIKPRFHISDFQAI